VLFVVSFHCLFVMMGSVQMVGVRQVRVMRGFFMLTGLVMLGRHSVMFRGLLVVLGRFFMVLVNFEGHGCIPFRFLSRSFAL
jgi:hypothetical protein